MTNTNKQLLLGKIETIYGTDPVPTGAANAMWVEGLEVVPLESAEAKSEVATGDFTKAVDTPYDEMARVSFIFDLTCASAAADAPPIFGYLLRACAMQEVIAAGVSVKYTPVYAAWESATLYAYMGDTLHKIVGARGTWTITVQRGLPKIKFDMQGFFVDPADVVVPAPTYSGQLKPKPINKDNTAFVIGGASLILNSYTLQANTQLQFRDRPNYRAVDVEDGAPGGTIVVHQPPLATFDAFAKAKAPVTPVAATLTHTLAVGRSIAIDTPVLQIKKPTYTADGKQRLLNMPVEVKRNGANPVATLTFT